MYVFMKFLCISYKKNLIFHTVNKLNEFSQCIAGASSSLSSSSQSCSITIIGSRKSPSFVLASSYPWSSLSDTAFSHFQLNGLF